MAKKITTIVELTDDLDGGKADQTVTFAWNGAQYEIDLSKKNAAALQKAIKPYIDAARRIKPTRRSSLAGAGKSPRRGDLAQVREWARANGHEISDRGRIPQSIFEAYDASS